MESPHLYETTESYKKSAAKMKLFPQHDDYGAEANSELSSPENFLDIANLLGNSNVSESTLIQNIEDQLTFNKSPLAAAMTASSGPRALSHNPSTNPGDMYNPLAYLPQAVHGGSQFERYAQHNDRHSIKEEPLESAHGDMGNHDSYSSCARGPYTYPNGLSSSYPVPVTVPGSESLMLKSPLRSPGSLKAGQKPKNVDKASDEYRRRRERNNIAVRKSREKAKMRTKETEEKVKFFHRENERLQKKCDQLAKDVDFFQKVIGHVDFQQLPEHVQQQYHQYVTQRYNQHMLPM